MELVKEVLCPDCEQSTQIRVSTLREMSARLRLSRSSIYNDQVDFACPHCKRLAIAFVRLHSHWSDIVDQAESSGGIAEFLVALECAGSNCLSRVQVLAPMIHGTNEFQVPAQVRDWTNAGLECAEGHPLSNSLQIAGIRQF